MSARDDYPTLATAAAAGALTWDRALDEIDRLRAENACGGEVCQYVKGYDGSRFCGLNMPDKWEAIRQTVNCPTCGGTMFDGCACFPPGMKGAHVTDCGTARRCGDCTDGKIDMARLLAVGAAVFKTYGVNDFGAEAWGHVKEFIETLRQVRP